MFSRDASKRYIYNFNSLLSNSTEVGVTEVEKTHFPMFLSLHNSFATNPSQYNYRTALFFKNTIPVLNYGDRMPTSVNDWFSNGIYCTYFKPEVVIQNNTF
jgi:hypothetical protein